ncbi:MAG TPA: helix-turn-helix transcriptional regulator [Actinomycetota bacterium]|nr:helix-turn-helix transcriptional regulator [Actinomycetota bacterium]
MSVRSSSSGRRLAPSPVGVLLQHWRRERRMSQLVLSSEAGVTPRHVSFVESGRSHPSRDMVLTLARALDVPLRERNELLLAAGYAPIYRETGLDDEALSQVRDALDRVLRHHEPYPAVVMNRYWDVMLTNAAADSMFAWLLDGAEGEQPPNVIRLMFKKIRSFVSNWEQFGEALVQRVHREAIGGVSDPTTAALLDEVLALPGIPPGWRSPDFGATHLPVLPIHFAKDGFEVSYFSMVTTVGTPQDITLQEIRLESFFPADSRTERHRWAAIL